MGSPCHLSLCGGPFDELERAAKIVIEEVEKIEQRYSRYREDSALSDLNLRAFSPQGVVVDDEMAGLLDYANTCYEESDGLFDVTSGLLRRAWNFQSQVATLPSQSTIDQLLKRVGWGKVIWDRPLFRFRVADMELDFGGIAKEFAADRAVHTLLNLGIRSGVVNFGGDLRVIGPRPDGSPWEVGIHHPHHAGELLATLHLHQGAVTTSGSYERYFEVAGKRYCHLLNPKTGWPVRGLASVSVVAPLALIAGSASTIAMLKGKGGPQWLKTMGLPSLWVTDRGKIGDLKSPQRSPKS